MNEVLSETRERMQKSTEAFEANISTIRTGRANPAVLNRVYVDYYGTRTPLSQLATVSSPDPRTLLVVPYDKSALGEVERAILDSDLGFNPNNKGDSIFISVPPLNDERRRDLVKMVRNMGEEAKVAIRNIRRDANDELKELHKESLLTEDEFRHDESEVQKLTDEFVAGIDRRLKAKEEDIMAV
ncbi:MAG TPA: ribosome recycling factor [Trueperaceae bacterium]